MERLREGGAALVEDGGGGGGAAALAFIALREVSFGVKGACEQGVLNRNGAQNGPVFRTRNDGRPPPQWNLFFPVCHD